MSREYMCRLKFIGVMLRILELFYVSLSLGVVEFNLHHHGNELKQSAKTTLRQNLQFQGVLLFFSKLKLGAQRKAREISYMYEGDTKH